MAKPIASLVLSAMLLLGVALPPAGASAAGGLRFLDCITGKLPPGKAPRAARPGRCKPIPPAVLDAEGSGLAYPGSLAASPDGRSLYAVSSRDDTVIVLRARPLEFQECLSANTEPGPRGAQPCRLLPNAGKEDVLSGFNGVRFVTVSPDGRSVYTISNDQSLGIFARNRRSGRLTYRGCITGATGPNSTGKRRVCRPIPTATPIFDGTHSGLGGPATLTVSPDGRFVYVAARADAAVSTFARAGDGSLSFQGCLTGGITAVVSGFASACTPVGPDNSHGSGLRGVKRIVLSPDGASLYASSPGKSSVAEFQRDPNSGQLTYRGCITGESRGLGPGNPCRPIPSAQEAGFDSGMWLVEQLAISGDGRFLYGLARGDDAVDVFGRDPVTGELSLLEVQPAGAKPTDLELSPGGGDLLVAAAGDSAIVDLRRDPGSGALSTASCLTARSSVAHVGPCRRATGRGGAPQAGFGGLSSLALAGGGLYATATSQSAVSRFAIPGG
jgi:DNA-binding beta-propeller fold protein YncE